MNNNEKNIFFPSVNEFIKYNELIKEKKKEIKLLESHRRNKENYLINYLDNITMDTINVEDKYTIVKIKKNNKSALKLKKKREEKKEWKIDKISI